MSAWTAVRLPVAVVTRVQHTVEGRERGGMEGEGKDGGHGRDGGEGRDGGDKVKCLASTIIRIKTEAIKSVT